ncbi:MAG: histidinol dehydrogenase [Gracilimonas sp.]|nr:histidinol dehydrogenase [Gracilimonas sp.]
MILQNSEAQISIDMPAGPSEVLVIADKDANPAYVAADLLSQAEHGSDSQVVLVATKSFDLDKLETELESQLRELPRKENGQRVIRKQFYCDHGIY